MTENEVLRLRIAGLEKDLAGVLKKNSGLEESLAGVVKQNAVLAVFAYLYYRVTVGAAA